MPRVLSFSPPERILYLSHLPVPLLALRLPWLVCPVSASTQMLLLRTFHHRTIPSIRARVPGTSPSTGMAIGVAWKSNLIPSTNISRSMQLEIRVFSPAIKYMPAAGNSPGRMLPVFGDHDEVTGVVVLDPRYCTSPGRITVTVSISRRLFFAHIDLQPLARGKVCHRPCKSPRWQTERDTTTHILHLFANILFCRAKRCTNPVDASGNPRQHCTTKAVESTSEQCHVKD